MRTPPRTTPCAARKTGLKLTRSIVVITLILSAVAACAFAFSSSSSAKLGGQLAAPKTSLGRSFFMAAKPQPPEPASPRPDTGAAHALVTTDKTDYQPGETVVIHGTGWAAGETVQLSLHEESSGRPDTNLTAEADEYGVILNKEFSVTQENLGSSFTLTATGQASGRTATARFTDGGTMSYSPSSPAFTVFSGPSGSTSATFTQNITAPAGNGNFQASRQVTSVAVGMGSTPMPNGWVTVSPTSRNFSTGNPGPSAHTDTKSWDVTVTPPANTAPGLYTAVVTAVPPVNSGVATGQGSTIFLTVTADNAPPSTTVSAIDSNNNPYSGVNFTNANKVTVTLTATDNGGSGVKVTRYKVDNGPYQDYSGPFDIAAQGISVITYFSIDNAGAQETPSAPFTVKIDKTAPVINCGQADASWHLNDVSIPCAAVDGGGQQKSGLANPADASFSLSTNVSPNTETSNAQTNSYQVCDNAGNCATAGPIGGNMVDKKAPTFDCDDPSNSWLGVDAIIPCTASDGGSGTSTTNFSLYTSVTPGTEDANASTNTENVCDAVGNCVTAGPIGGNKIDKKDPVITASAAKADSNAYNAGDWTNQSVTVSYQCTDGGSGVANVDGPATLSGEGQNQAATGNCSDNVGHTAQATFTPINIDKTDPTLSFDSYLPAPNGAGWNNTNVSVAFTSGDALSGVASTSTASPLVLSDEGSSVMGSVTVTDVAGNSKMFTTNAVKIDKTAPALAPARHAGSEANGAGWNKSAVTVDANASDALSGISSVSPSASQTVSGEGQNQSVSFTATDVAGNSASASLGGINIDLTPPTINATRTPGPNSFGWNNTDVTASYTASDALSGLTDPSSGNHVFSSEGAGQSHTFTVHDAAGNSSDASVTNVNIDKTAPVVTITTPANGGTYVLNSIVAANFSTSDALSGLNLSTQTSTTPNGSNISTSPVGPKSFSVSVSDKAGNPASKTNSYNVAYAPVGTICSQGPGRTILQPINSDGTSVFKKGSTVPAKFRVYDANCNSIGTPGVVADFRLITIISGTSTSNVNEAVDSTASDPAFRWSATDQQWIFNINTKNLSANMTYVFQVSLNDGTAILFQFGLK